MQLRSVPPLTPRRIALAYLVLGMGALFVSDILLVQSLSEPLLSQVQAVKGGIEVLLTAGFIYVLTNRREAQLQRSMARIDQQREELQVLHRVLRHNLRNDLNVIQGYAGWIHERLQADRLDAECETIEETAEQMVRYTEQAARIRRIGNTDEYVTTYDLTDTIPRLLEGHPRVTDDVEVSTTLPDCATVEANPMFEGALEEVLTNALEYNDAATPWIGIEVDRESGPAHMVEIRIADNGPGIPESELEPLRAPTEDQVLHLSGLGLWFVAWTVRRSGGEVAFEDSEQGGTTVIIRAPTSGGLSRPISSPLVPPGPT